MLLAFQSTVDFCKAALVMFTVGTLLFESRHEGNNAPSIVPLVMDEEGLKLFGGFPDLSFHQCLDTVDWMIEGHLAHENHQLLVPKYSLPEKWRKNTEGKLAKVYPKSSY